MFRLKICCIGSYHSLLLRSSKFLLFATWLGWVDSNQVPACWKDELQGFLISQHCHANSTRLLASVISYPIHWRSQCPAVAFHFRVPVAFPAAWLCFRDADLLAPWIRLSWISFEKAIISRQFWSLERPTSDITVPLGDSNMQISLHASPWQSSYMDL